MKTPAEFVRRYNGVQIDWDGVYGTQCVDGWKVFLEWAGIPVRATPNGWHWQSDVDGNVWEPGVYGWSEV